MAERAWFITGVSSGFGREMTEQLLERGDRVAGTVRDLDSVRDLTEKYGDRFWSAHLDVTDTGEIRKVVDEAFERPRHDRRRRQQCGLRTVRCR